MNVSFHGSAKTGVSMCRSPQGNVTYEFVLTSSACSACLVRLTWRVCKMGGK